MDRINLLQGERAMLEIKAHITSQRSYQPLLCRELETVSSENLDNELQKRASYFLSLDDNNKIALSWWVSAKRTRSYPYARVYDTLSFTGKRVTIIPVYKDEGADGDRDHIQWDTISLMSLLNVYVIISFYKGAEKSKRYQNKITRQRFDVRHVKGEILKLLNYQSDALHWNLDQAQKAGDIGRTANKAYQEISHLTGVRMHSYDAAEKRFSEIENNAQAFIHVSRGLARTAQGRESQTQQPKEEVVIEGKTRITITNYLGGEYNFTVDEARLEDGILHIIESKHSLRNPLPGISDIKDGLIKMCLFTNLQDVVMEEERFEHKAALRLTTSHPVPESMLSARNKRLLELLRIEAEVNKFEILF
jgi:hypothetical protein